VENYYNFNLFQDLDLQLGFMITIFIYMEGQI